MNTTAFLNTRQYCTCRASSWFRK